jgi:TonB family protein
MRMKALAVVAVTVLACPAWADDVPRCGAPGIVPAKAANSHIAENYPPVSVALSEEGTTTAEFTVTPEGVPTDLKVTKSSGSMRLDQAAQDEILGKWRYTPARLGDKPIACIQTAEVKWVLHDDNSKIPAFVVELFRKNALKMKLEDYPEEARTRRQEGLVLVQIEVGPDGKSGTLLLSSGFPELDRAALRIIPDRVNLTPAESGGQTFSTRALIPVLWSLDGVPPSGK